MGIVNVTPDSFSDGGYFLNTGAAIDHALRMLEDGADIIDVGGESTRPNATPVSAAEEQARVLPVLKGILQQKSDAVLSLDTYRAETAKAAVDAGVEIINDVSGNLWDSEMAATCAKTGAGLVLMHTRGRPQEWKSLPALGNSEVVRLVTQGLRARADAAIAAGVDRDAIVVDPGFGFGKILEENYPLLAGLGSLVKLGFPVLAGLSRKSFLTRAVGISDPDEALRTAGSLPLTPEQVALATEVGNAAAILGGAHILRVHDVASARRTASITDRLLEARGNT